MVSRGIQANRRVSSSFQVSGTTPAVQDLPLGGGSDALATAARFRLSSLCSAALSSLESWNCESGSSGRDGEAASRFYGIQS